jgi:hypothetical protein
MDNVKDFFSNTIMKAAEQNNLPIYFSVKYIHDSALMEILAYDYKETN